LAYDGTNLDRGHNTNWLFGPYSLAISPASVTLNPLAVQNFTYTGYDIEGTVITGFPATWSANVVAGSIDNTGHFTASATPGNYLNAVSITSYGKTGYASVVISAPASSPTPSATVTSTPCANGKDFDGDGNVDLCLDNAVLSDLYVQNIDDLCAGQSNRIVYYYFSSNYLEPSEIPRDTGDIHDVYISTDGGRVYRRIAQNIDFYNHAVSVENLPSGMPTRKVRQNPSPVYYKVTYDLIIPSEYVSDQTKILVHMRPSKYQHNSISAWPDYFNLGRQFTASQDYQGINYIPGTPYLNATDFTNTVKSKNCAADKFIDVAVSPDQKVIEPSKAIQYSAKVTDQDGNDVTSNCPVTWSMQIPSAGSIKSSGKMIATSELGIWRYAVKATAHCFGLSDFGLASFVTTKEARVLDYVSIYFPTTTVIQKGVTSDTANFIGGAVDQFGMRLGKEVAWNWELLDNRAGDLQQNETKPHLAQIVTSNNYGCYAFKVKASGNYGGKTLSAYTSLSIYPPDYQLGLNGSNCDSDFSSKLAGLLSGAGRAQAAEPGPVLSSITVADHFNTRPGEMRYLYTNALDQYGNPAAHEARFILLDPNAGSLSSTGEFIATDKLGTYPDAIEVRASQGDIVLSAKATVIVTNEKRKAVELYSHSPVNIATNSGRWIYVGLRDQFGEGHQVQMLATAEDVSGQNLFDVSHHTVLEANNKEGRWKKAIKITLDLNKYNQRIAREEDKFEGPDPELYLDLQISKSFFSDPTQCLKDSGGGTDNPVKSILSFFSSLKNNLILKNILALLSPLLLLAVLLSSLLSQLMALIASLPLLYRLVNALFSLFAPAAWPGRKPSWGVIYDAVDKRPLENVVIRIFSEPNGRLKSTIRSNINGTFGFILPPGKYSIIAYKAGFNFPSKLVMGSSDGTYQRIYRGGVFDVAGDGQQKAQVNVNIPLDRTNISSFDIVQIKTLVTISEFFQSIRLPVMILGTIATGYLLIVEHRTIDYVIGALYIGLWALEIRNMIKKRAYGIVRDDLGQPVAMALIRTFDIRGQLKNTVVSGDDGKFQLNLDPGQYSLDVSRGGYKSIRIELFRVDKTQDIGRFDLRLDKLSGE
jgi:hypothetical protein